MGFVSEITDAGAIPSLEMTLRFAGQRQRLIANTIANFDTPDYRPMDVSVQGFQQTLRDAIDRRRGRTGSEHGPLEWEESRELARGDAGGLTLRPRTPSGNILFHDRNNRDLERTMQAMVENVGVYRMAADLLRNRYNLLNTAISERV